MVDRWSNFDPVESSSVFGTSMMKKSISLSSYRDDAFERSDEVAPGTPPLLFSAMVARSSSVESDTMDDAVVVLLLRNASEKNSPSASSQGWPPSPPDDDMFSLSGT